MKYLLTVLILLFSSLNAFSQEGNTNIKVTHLTISSDEYKKDSPYDYFKVQLKLSNPFYQFLGHYKGKSIINGIYYKSEPENNILDDLLEIAKTRKLQAGNYTNLAGGCIGDDCADGITSYVLDNLGNIYLNIIYRDVVFNKIDDLIIDAELFAIVSDKASITKTLDILKRKIVVGKDLGEGELSLYLVPEVDKKVETNAYENNLLIKHKIKSNKQIKSIDLLKINPNDKIGFYLIQTLNDTLKVPTEELRFYKDDSNISGLRLVYEPKTKTMDSYVIGKDNIIYLSNKYINTDEFDLRVRYNDAQLLRVKINKNLVVDR